MVLQQERQYDEFSVENTVSDSQREVEMKAEQCDAKSDDYQRKSPISIICQETPRWWQYPTIYRGSCIKG